MKLNSYEQKPFAETRLVLEGSSVPQRYLGAADNSSDFVFVHTFVFKQEVVSRGPPVEQKLSCNHDFL